MWGYKDKLTKIVIEDTKSVKTAEDGGKVYGPFDESEYGTKAVESYVVCEVDDANCVGYLQSNGKVIANSDSSWLFGYFSNVTKIDGLENLNTSNVTDMSNMFGGSTNIVTLDVSSFDSKKLIKSNGMFGGMNSLQELNLSNFIFPKDYQGMFNVMPLLETLDLTNVNTSKITSMNAMFVNLEKLKTLDLSYFDTSHVTNMQAMFMNCSSLQELNLSSFDTSSVTSMQAMFINTTNLQTITFGPNFVHKPEATTSGMFTGCASQDRPSGDTWTDVSFE